MQAHEGRITGSHSPSHMLTVPHETFQVLCELYNLTFVTGSAVPVADVINQLLAVPAPSAAIGQVR